MVWVPVPYYLVLVPNWKNYSVWVPGCLITWCNSVPVLYFTTKLDSPVSALPSLTIWYPYRVSIATRYGNPDSCLLPNRGFAGTAAKTRQKMGKHFLELRLVDRRFNFFIFLNLRRPRARTREQNNVCGYVIIERREIDWYKDLENLRRDKLYGKFLSNHFK